MNWFKKLLPLSIRTQTQSKRSIPEGLWTSCKACKATLFRAEVERNENVCVKCGHHMRIGARARLERFLDPATAKELSGALRSRDFLKFKDTKRYRDRLISAQKMTGENDALIVMEGQLKGIELIAARARGRQSRAKERQRPWIRRSCGRKRAL